MTGVTWHCNTVALCIQPYSQDTEQVHPHKDPLWSFITTPPSFLPPLFLTPVCVTQSCPTLCDPMAAAHQAPPSMGSSRQEDWSGVPFPSPADLPDPGIEPESPALQADPSPSEPPGNPFPYP